MKSSNPILRDDVIENTYAITDRPMTVSGSVNKLMLLGLILMIAAGAVYYQFSLHHYDFVNMLTWGGVIVGFILALIISFAHKTTPYLAPVYAFAEGAALSGISCFFEAAYPGIVIQAISMTFIVVFAMAVLYKLGIIRATEKFKAVIFSVTLAIGIFYLISLVLMFFHINIPYFTSNSPLMLGINIVIAGIAALNLIIDFDFIENGARRMLPSLYEWYGAFGLMVTIVWLYIEILRILSRMRNR